MGMWEYPSQLNFSALRFERCAKCHEPCTNPTSPSSRRPAGPLRSKSPCCDGEKAAGKSRREKSDNRARRVKPKKKNMKTSRRTDESDKCLNSILGDDLILCRLSALLAPLFEDLESEASKPALLRRVSSSDIDDACSDDRSDESLQRVPAFTLIPGDTAVVLPQILPTDSDLTGPAQSLLSAVGIEEVEALDPSNGGPSAGQCQFACIASALSKSFGLDRPLRDGYRPDLELRSLALHTVRMNPDMYRDFMTVAGGRTRKQNAAGGSSVDLNSYLRTMSSPSCDGDAVTLQALCDALKITIRIVKTVDAAWYNEQRQRERLLGSASISTSGRSSLGSESCDDDGASSVTTAESSFSSLSWSNNPYSSCEHMSFISETSDEDNRAGRHSQRLYVSEEIQPRQLPCVDSRIRDVQNVARGRLIWLSHIGDEVHYRFLRPLAIPHKRSDCKDVSTELYTCNEEEARIARFSRMRRHHLLMNSHALQDGYARIFSGDAQTNLRKGFDSAARASLEQQCANDPSLTPRCGLCLGAFVGAWSDESKNPVSPSCCHHDYCQDCIVSWSEHVGNNCPSCGCLFMALVDSLSGRIVRSFSTDCVLTTGAVLNLDDVDCRRDKPRGDDSSVSSFEENNGAMGNELEGGPITAKNLARSVHSILADLDSSFAQAAAGLSRKQAQLECDQDTPTSLLQDFFVEIARSRRADANQIGGMLEDVFHFLTQRNAGAAADELLDAGLLRAIRLLLSASRVQSPLRDTAVEVKDSERHVVSTSLFLKSVSILEKITSLCAREILTWSKMQNGFGLPKLLLWYVTCNPYDVPPDHSVIVNTLQVLMQWSKHFGLSLVDAVHESKARPESCAKGLVSSPKPPQGKKLSSSSSVPSLSRKRKICPQNIAASANVATTRSKRARRTISVEDKKSHQ